MAPIGEDPLISGMAAAIPVPTVVSILRRLREWRKEESRSGLIGVGEWETALKRASSSRVRHISADSELKAKKLEIGD